MYKNKTLKFYFVCVILGPSQPNSMEGRAKIQRDKVRRKFEERRSQGFYPQQPRPRNGKQKGKATGGSRSKGGGLLKDIA
jgi:hypothetical protein